MGRGWSKLDSFEALCAQKSLETAAAMEERRDRQAVGRLL